MPRKPAAKTSGTYALHRERQRYRILEAASRLFDERGIDRTTMAELISSSGLQPSTVYAYFSSKDDIVWAILGQIIETSSANFNRVVELAPTGLARITALLEQMAEEFTHHPARIRFLAQFDAMYARHWPAERLLTLESQISDQGFEAFRSLILDGIADGSLRPDLDPDLTLHAVTNAVIAAQRRLASLGPKVEIEYGQPVERLFRETIRILILGLRAPGPPARAKSKPRPSPSKRAKKKRNP